MSQKIGFVQPFGLASPGGGSKILRALAVNSPVLSISVATCPDRPPDCSVLPEFHVPARPYFGRIERTRYQSQIDRFAFLWAANFRSRLRDLLISQGVTDMHIIPHSIDSMDALQVAQELKIPFHLSIHDDYGYALLGRPGAAAALAKLSTAWKKATNHFVISREMGEEYCERYGRKNYLLVTDGLTQIAPSLASSDPTCLRVYFMGLFHYSYIDNLQALLECLSAYSREHPETKVSLTLRCGSLPDSIRVPNDFPVNILPFAPESQVTTDLKTADLLYMPLPFGAAYESFTRFSLSTKMITYLGSGIPILYHGPIQNCAAGRLLSSTGAALCVDSLKLQDLMIIFAADRTLYRTTAEFALKLARAEFQSDDIRRRFWQAITLAPST